MDRTLRSPTLPTVRGAHRPLVLRLLLIVAGAFCFGFALVPLYDVFCKATGFNGKVPLFGDLSGGRFAQGGLQPAGESPPSAGAPAATTQTVVDTSRIVTVEFTGTVMPGLPWDVRPLTTTLDLHPGELQVARFLVHNRSSETVVGHAVPSVTPGQAAQHFDKIDCFCFTQQSLLPGEARELAVAFIVKPAIDRDVRTVTLAYAFFRPPATFKAAPSAAAANASTNAPSRGPT
jgi:cytochrome c oxidase assembly protein subunit 11